MLEITFTKFVATLYLARTKCSEIPQRGVYATESANGGRGFSRNPFYSIFFATGYHNAPELCRRLSASVHVTQSQRVSVVPTQINTTQTGLPRGYKSHLAPPIPVGQTLVSNVT